MKDFKYFALTILSIFFISEALKAAPPGRRAPSRTSKSPSKAVESRRPALPTSATDAARNSLLDLSSRQNIEEVRLPLIEGSPTIQLLDVDSFEDRTHLHTENYKYTCKPTSKF